MLRSGFLLVALLVGAQIGTTAAFADGEDRRGENVRKDDRIARLTKAQNRMRRMLEKGEQLEQAGKLEAALECYESALEAYDSVMRETGRDPRSMRSVSARRMGATKKTDAAVALALKWLARHQDESGRWDSKGFKKHDPPDDRCDGPGKEVYDVGLTGLSVLAFPEAGYTDRGSKKDNPYAKTVRQGLRYLIRLQDEQGCFGARKTQHFLYNHAIATAAIAEAYALTKNPRYRAPAMEAVGFLHHARNPYMAWRYQPRGGENDTSMSGWCVYALARARASGLPIDEAAMKASMQGALAWIDKMTDAETGRAGYNMRGGAPARPEGLQDKFPPAKSESMTASALAMRIHAGQSTRRDEFRRGLKLLIAKPPIWNQASGAIDLYYWFWGTRACLAAGGKEWKAWNTALTEAVVKHQHRDGSGSRTGSWDPLGPWGPDGGRIYSTALLALTMQSYYRAER